MNEEKNGIERKKDRGMKKHIEVVKDLTNERREGWKERMNGERRRK